MIENKVEVKDTMIAIFYLFSFIGITCGGPRIEVTDFVPFKTSISITCSVSDDLHKQYNWSKGTTTNIIASCFNFSCFSTVKGKYVIEQTKMTSVLTILHPSHMDSGKWHCERDTNVASINLYFYPVGYQAPVVSENVHQNSTNTVLLCTLLVLIFVVGVVIMVVYFRKKWVKYKNAASIEVPGNANDVLSNGLNGNRQEDETDEDNYIPPSIGERKDMLNLSANSSHYRSENDA